jgi:hypothetical protein
VSNFAPHPSSAAILKVVEERYAAIASNGSANGPYVHGLRDEQHGVHMGDARRDFLRGARRAGARLHERGYIRAVKCIHSRLRAAAAFTSSAISRGSES